MNKIEKVKTDILNKGFSNIDPSDIELISSIQSSGKYILDLTPDKSRQWIIRKNPNYINQNWHDIKMAFIGATLTFVASIILWQLDKQAKLQEIQQLKDRLNKIENTLNYPTKK